MDIKKLKRTLQKALNKTDFYTECFLAFHNQKSIPATFLAYIKMYDKEYLLQNANFEEYISLSNDKILMLSKEQNNYFIFVFYE